MALKATKRGAIALLLSASMLMSPTTVFAHETAEDIKKQIGKLIDSDTHVWLNY